MYTTFVFKTKKAYTKTTYFLSPPFYVAVILFTGNTFETLNVSKLEMYKQKLKCLAFCCFFCYIFLSDAFMSA